MTAIRALIWVVFALFMALSIEVLWQFGAAGFLAAVFANGATTLAFIDLAIALTLAILVVARDAARTGRRAWPYVLLTLTFGSAGPLLYLALHPEAAGLARAAGAAEAQTGRTPPAAYGSAPGR
jgi:hypothetical protein